MALIVTIFAILLLLLVPWQSCDSIAPLQGKAHADTTAAPTQDTPEHAH